MPAAAASIFAAMPDSATTDKMGYSTQVEIPNEYRNAMERKFRMTNPPKDSPRDTSGMKKFVIMSKMFQPISVTSTQPTTIIRLMGIRVSNQTVTKSGSAESSLNRWSFPKLLITKPTNTPATMAAIDHVVGVGNAAGPLPQRLIYRVL